MKRGFNMRMIYYMKKGQFAYYNYAIYNEQGSILYTVQHSNRRSCRFILHDAKLQCIGAVGMII